MLQGDIGGDSLLGGTGEDHLQGGADDDRLDGGQGRDLLAGGRGDDAFVFSDGQDRVLDFADDRDTILLDASLWGGGQRSAAAMLGYADAAGGDTVFRFPDGSTLTIEGLAHPDRLLDDLGLA